MESPENFEKQAVEVAVKIGLLFLLLYFCFEIMRPFIALVIWAMILSVALYPVHLKIRQWLGGKNAVAAGLLVIVGLALILVPGWSVATSAVDSFTQLSEQFKTGSIEIPAPAEDVKDWPLVGEKLHEHWSLAAADITRYLGKFGSQIGDVMGEALGLAGGVIGGLLSFCFSFIIAGVFLASADKCSLGAKLIAKSLLGENGEKIIQLSGATIQSVAKGVLGVAVIQTALVSVGFFAAGLPAAAILSLIVLVMAIAQLPTFLVMIPTIVYVFNNDTTLVAVLYTVWMLVAGFSENILKPLLLGRGVDVPMLVILIGALGGMIMMGFVGLFLGAVMLAIGFQLLSAWISSHNPPDSSSEAS